MEEFIKWCLSLPRYSRWWIANAEFERLVVLLRLDQRVLTDDSLSDKPLQIRFRNSLAIYPKAMKPYTAYPERERW